MTSPTTISLSYQAVGHRFERRALFAGLTATFRHGDVVAVLGANGAGKSTLLKITAGLTRPTSGEVALARGDQRLSAAEHRAQVGYAAPDSLPYRPLTVAENIDFFARLRGVEPEPDLLARLGLADRADQTVSELSSGYVQRVRLALAVLHQPALLLLDEPGANLDEAGHGLVADVVARQRERGICLIAANDPRDIAYGNRIIELGR